MITPTQVPTAEEVVDACGEEPSWICRWVIENYENAGVATAADVLLARPLKIALILLVAWVVNRLVRRGIRRFTARLADPDISTLGAIGRMGKYTPTMLATTTQVNVRASARAETLSGVLRSVATVFIWGMAILMVLGELAINLGPLIAGAGVAGVALGFGAQSLVKDFLSGIFMLIEDQYGVGDVVDVGEAIGVVEGMTLRSTRLRALDGAVWHVPNGEIARVGNMSQQWSRALLDVEVAYGTDLTHAREVIARVADEVYQDPAWRGIILEAPEIWGVEALAADGIAIRLVLKTRPGEQWGLQRELRARLKDVFDAEGIEIPFPQRVVWFGNDDDHGSPPRPTPAPSGPSPSTTPRPTAPPPPPDAAPADSASEDAHQAKGDPAEPPPG
ncbi:MAG: mechanosensitive ion channel family protein [Acidimicrobiales bacterium]